VSIGGLGGGAHFALAGRSVFPCVSVGATVAQTQRIDEPLSVSRGQPVGPLLATSSGGGDIAADPLAARPVLVIFSQRPGLRKIPVPRRVAAARLLVMRTRSGPVPSGDCPGYSPSRSPVRPIRRAGYFRKLKTDGLLEPLLTLVAPKRAGYSAIRREFIQYAEWALWSASSL
jgi:hypothetical protein